MLAFVFGDHQLSALHKGREVSWKSLANIVEDFKSQCSGMYVEFFYCLFINKYFFKSQYWLQGDYEATFRKHLTMIKDFYGELWSVVHDGVCIVAPPVLDKYGLESEQPLFKMAMVANSSWAMEPPTIGSDASKPLVNPVTKLWHRLDANLALSMSFPEYIKLVQIALIHLLGSIEDECAFSSVTLLKNKIQNRLDGEHLNLVVRMYNQLVYSLTLFPYEDYFKQWLRSYEFHYINTTA